MHWLAAKPLGAELALHDAIVQISIVKLHGEKQLGIDGRDSTGIQQAVKENPYARADGIPRLEN